MRITRWDQELDVDFDHVVISTLALRHFESVSDDIGQTLASWLLNRDFKALLAFEIDYSTLSLSDCLHVRQGLAFFQKRKDLDIGIDKEAVALAKFVESEKLCKETNDIFKARAEGRFQLPSPVERVLWHASNKISSILGDIPKLSDLDFKFGPGATTQVKRKEASSRAKLGDWPACSIELFPSAPLVLQEMQLWYNQMQIDAPVGPLPLPIHAGKVAFVPKSAKEFRTVMVEPLLNTMCQAGIGSFMAERLRSCGVDIRDQTRNQRLARQGSVDGSLATVDLSSASDTIATELVYDLLGIDWGSFLSRYRTGSAEVGGSVIRLEKFSSMGNGFTFPLETLIFYALAWGCCLETGCSVRDVSAYGDDVIVPTQAYDLLTAVFTSCGFKVNRKKSFAQGPFRESCGADYYLGTDIRPVYLKDRPCGFDIFRLHNFYYRNYDFEATAFLVSFIDKSIQLYGPDGYGDGHLLGEWVRTKKEAHALSGYDGFTFDTFSFRPRRSFKRSKGYWILPAYTIYRTSTTEDRSSLSGTDARFKKGSDAFSVTNPGTDGFNRISIYTLMR